MDTLTARQSNILDFIEQSIKDNNMPPTRGEISTYFGFKSANAAEEHLRAIAKKGYIKILPGTARGILLTNCVPSSLQEELLKLSRIMGREFGDKVGSFVSTYANNIKD